MIQRFEDDRRWTCDIAIDQVGKGKQSLIRRPWFESGIYSVGFWIENQYQLCHIIELSKEQRSDFQVWVSYDHLDSSKLPNFDKRIVNGAIARFLRSKGI